MDRPALTLPRLARGAATLAVLVGVYHFLYLMGAFGPVSCWTSHSASGSASSSGAETTTTRTVTRGCESGIDALLGSGGGNATVLFSWALVLLVLVTLGGYGAWTGRRRLTWATAVVGAASTVVGIFSIGWFFLLPTVFLLVAATALSIDARRSEA